MANNNIFLGSGATISFVPETDIYLELEKIVANFATTDTSTTATISDTTGIEVGMKVTGTGIPADTTVTAIVADTSITLSNAATATNSSVSLTIFRATGTTFTIDTNFTSNFNLVNNLYVGCLVEVIDSSASKAVSARARVTANTATTITVSPSIDLDEDDFLVITQYGAPIPAPNATHTSNTYKRLFTDWVGITESLTFPSTEIEMKQTNLSLGGSRNYTYQYKGIETASGGNIGLVANHASWLYYFFGRCTAISATTTSSTPTSKYAVASGDSGKTYLNPTSVDTGPLFRRTVGTVLTPPVAFHLEAHTDLDEVTLPSGTTSISNAITYTFAEQEGDLLPSFSLEQVISKLEGNSDGGTYTTNNANADEDLNFVKIARGNRVNTMTITANENEEIKMTMDLNTRTVHSLEKTERYEARRGITDETTFPNYNSVDEFREPFFFSSGYFKIFGQQFLKINSLTLTMNNNLADRRFIGVGNKSIKEGIPAQRTYELQFTGHVTDDRLYTELLNQAENDNTGQYIELQFEKSNGENFNLKFTDYMVSANNFPIADDKGAIVVETTVMPRTLQSCTAKTHWILQG